MKKLFTHFLMCSLFMTISYLPVMAQPTVIVANKEVKPLTKEERKEVVESVSQELDNNYIYPKVAKEMTGFLKQKMKDGKYDAFTTPYKFAQQLTTDLRSISQDLHLRVNFSPQGVAELRAMERGGEDQKQQEEKWINRLKQSNFGFEEVKILEGNIGYLNLTGFADPWHGGEAAVAAMNFLSNSNALIIDLRYNVGGSTAMIPLIASYLFDVDPIHLNNFYWRPSDQTTQTWTLPHISGKRRPDMDVYVLTSGGSFSAAEEFSYDLKHLKRATLIGETTGGGAHPGGTQIATDRFTVWIPSGRAINPITGTSWEGKGVKPHIEVPQEDALSTAHVKALETLAEKAKTPEEKSQIAWNLAPVKAKMNPVDVSEATLESYVGQYGSRVLTFENGRLFYQREKRPKHELIALADDLFAIESISSFRLKVVKENNKVVALETIYDNGHVQKNMKIETKP